MKLGPNRYTRVIQIYWWLPFLLAAGLLAAGFTLVAILITRVQVTMLLGDIAAALASADADRVYYEEQLNSFKVSRTRTVYVPGYWRQRADKGLGDPPPSCNQEPLVVKDDNGRPTKRTSWWCTASIHAEAV